MKKLSIKKSITAFIEGWVEELADPFTSWLYQSVLHWNVIMLIADGTFNDYDISFEDICLKINPCLLYTSPSPRDMRRSRMPSSA